MSNLKDVTLERARLCALSLAIKTVIDEVDSGKYAPLDKLESIADELHELAHGKGVDE